MLHATTTAHTPTSSVACDRARLDCGTRDRGGALDVNTLDIDEPTVGDAHRPVGERNHHGVVGGDYGGHAFCLDYAANERHHRESRLGVELAGGFVGDEQ